MVLDSESQSSIIYQLVGGLWDKLEGNQLHHGHALASLEGKEILSLSLSCLS